MTEQDMITCATNLIDQVKYSITIYRDHNNNWCFMNLGVPENAWPEDIKETVGYMMYDNDKIYFLKYSDRENWSAYDKNLVGHLLEPEVARTEFEKRSNLNPPSRFEWKNK